MGRPIDLSRFVTSLINVSFQTWIGINSKYVFFSSGQDSEMSPQTGRLLSLYNANCLTHWLWVLLSLFDRYLFRLKSYGMLCVHNKGRSVFEFFLDLIMLLCFPAGSLFSIHGRKPNCWGGSRRGGRQFGIWQWWKSNCTFQKNYWSSSSHWSFRGIRFLSLLQTDTIL